MIFFSLPVFLNFALAITLALNKLICIIKTAHLPSSQSWTGPALVLWLPSILALDVFVLFFIHWLRSSGKTVLKTFSHFLLGITMLITTLNSALYVETSVMLRFNLFRSIMLDPVSAYTLVEQESKIWALSIFCMMMAASFFAQTVFLQIKSWVFSDSQAIPDYMLVKEEGDFSYKLTYESSNRCLFRSARSKSKRSICLTVIIVAYTSLAAVYRPRVPWAKLSSTPVLYIAGDAIKMGHNMIQRPGIFSSHDSGNPIRAQPVDLRKPTTRLKGKINNVVMLMLESGRRDIFQDIDQFLRDSNLQFVDGMGSEMMMTFVQEIYNSSWRLENSRSTACFTSKSFMSMMGGVWPVNELFSNYEMKDAVRPYMDTLPELVREFAKSKDLSSKSAYFTSSHDLWDNTAAMFDKLHFDESYRMKDIVADYNEDPELIGPFGAADYEILPLYEDWVKRVVVESSEPQGITLSSVVLTSTHYPFDIPNWAEEGKQTFVEDAHVNNALNTWQVADDFIRKIFAINEASGVADRTLYVFAGDHGVGLSSANNAVVNTLDNWQEHAYRTPLFFYSPSLVAGVHDADNSNMDILPSIMDVLISSHESETMRSNLFDLSSGECALQTLLAEYEGTSVFRKPVDTGREPRIHFGLDNPGKSHLSVKQGDMKFVLDENNDALSAYHLGYDRLEMIDLLDPQIAEKALPWLNISNSSSEISLSAIEPSMNDKILSAWPRPVAFFDPHTSKFVATNNNNQIDLLQVKQWTAYMLEISLSWRQSVKDRWSGQDPDSPEYHGMNTTQRTGRLSQSEPFACVSAGSKF